MIKQVLMSFLGLIFAVGYTSCGQNTNAQGGLLNANDFSKQLENTKDKQVIDVRTPEEFQGGHIKDAKNVNFYDQDFQQQIDKLDKNKPVFVYCKSGGRSGKAAAIIKNSGFKEVFDLEGGIMAWNNNNLPVESGTKESVPDKFTVADFQKLLSDNKLVLVDYYATWCAPCKQMEPWLSKLKTEYAGKVLVYRINVDEATALCKQEKIEGIPVLCTYKNQKEITRVKGLQTEENLRKMVTDLQKP